MVQQGRGPLSERDKKEFKQDREMDGEKVSPEKEKSSVRESMEKFTKGVASGGGIVELKRRGCTSQHQKGKLTG